MTSSIQNSDPAGKREEDPLQKKLCQETKKINLKGRLRRKRKKRKNVEERRKGVRKSSRLMEKPKVPPLTEIGSKSSGR